MKRASLSRASPDLVGPPCRPLWPEASSEGTRPLNDLTPARDRKRLGSLSRPRICADVHRPHARHRAQDVVGIEGAKHHGDALLELLDLGGQSQGDASFDRQVIRELAVVELVTPELERLV